VGFLDIKVNHTEQFLHININMEGCSEAISVARLSGWI